MDDLIKQLKQKRIIETKSRKKKSQKEQPLTDLQQQAYEESIRKKKITASVLNQKINKWLSFDGVLGFWGAQTDR